ncbi:MAG: hypothetical protein HN919_02540 [Verrucomicrobia bacterium]|nr:hypothetical protein [Verrucomicrobiota bacterium]
MIGLLLMIVMFLIPIWVALFVAGIILGIVGMSQKQRGGLALFLSSLLVPLFLAPAIGFFLFVAGVAAVGTAVEQASKPSPTIKAATASPANVKKRQIGYGSILAQLDAAAKSHSGAATAVQKDLAAKAISKKAAALLADGQMRFTVEIRDVRMNGGSAVISHNGLNDGGYARKQGVSLSVSPTASFHIKMSEEKAAKIRPGQKLTVLVDAGWRQHGSSLGATFAKSSPGCLATITSKAGYKPIGSIRMKLRGYKIQ